MADEEETKGQEIERELDRLISEAGRICEPGFNRPSEDSIRAYLLGKATSTQEADVHEALLKSSSFRHELARMSADLDELMNHKTLESAARYTPERIPDFSMYLRSPLPRRSLVDRIKEYVSIRWLVPAIASIAVVTVVVIRMSRYSESPEYSGWQEQKTVTRIDSMSVPATAPTLYAQAVVPGAAGEMNLAYFMGKSTRGVRTDRTAIYASSDQAAREAFSSAVTFENDKLSCLDGAESPARNLTGASIYVQIVDSNSIVIAELQHQRAAGQSLSEEQPEFWWLDLTSRRLSRISMAKDTLLVKSFSEPHLSAVLTLTYRNRDGYSAVPARCLER